jgi:hypothetical protein
MYLSIRGEEKFVFTQRGEEKTIKNSCVLKCEDKATLCIGTKD